MYCCFQSFKELLAFVCHPIYLGVQRYVPFLFFQKNLDIFSKFFFDIYKIFLSGIAKMRIKNFLISILSFLMQSWYSRNYAFLLSGVQR